MYVIDAYRNVQSAQGWLGSAPDIVLVGKQIMLNSRIAINGQHEMNTFAYFEVLFLIILSQGLFHPC